MSFTDMFSKEVKASKRSEKEASQKAKECISLAKRCLAAKEFESYKKQYQTAELKMVAALMALTDSYLSGRFDLSTYGSRVLVYMTRLKDLRSLLDVVTADANKRDNDGTN